MRCDWILPLPGGDACRWSVDGPQAIHDIFATFALGTGLKEIAVSDPPGLCRIVGLHREAWAAMPISPQRLVPEGLKVEWQEDHGSSLFVNIDALISGYQLLRLRRVMLLHSCLPIWLRGIGVMFHGALLRHDDQGIIIAGQSGTGKSTCMRKISSPWECWCDDCMLLVKHDNAFLARPLPTWSTYLIPDIPVTPVFSKEFLPVQSLLFLEQSLFDGFIPVTRTEAVLGTIPSMAEFIKYSGFAMPQTLKQEAQKRSLDFAFALTDSLPAQRMAHTLDGKPWEALCG